MIILWCIMAATLYLFWLSGLIMNRLRKTNGTRINPEDISVIIPFRNEVDHLPQLLNDLKLLKRKPAQFIFVDDHSEDQGVQLIEGAELQNALLLRSEKGKSGKKQALVLGISMAQGKYILTWDADIRIGQDYFDQLSLLPQADLIQLPVKMTGSSALACFASVDYAYLPALQNGLSVWYKLFNSSGANLLFKKQAWLDTRQDQDEKSFSGDDQFLLKRLNENGLHCYHAYESAAIVRTAAPAKLQDFLQQRLRWAKKTNEVGDHFANVLALLGILYHLMPISFLMVPDLFAKFIFPLKMLLDATILLVFYGRQKLFCAKGLIVFLPLYPLYLLLIGLLYSWFPLKWKGRLIQS